MSVAALDYALREYRPDDEDGVLRLLHLALGAGTAFARTADFWRWKHFLNPFGVSQLLLAVGGEVLGLRAFMRWGFRTPGGVLRAVRAVDTATHPDHRRLGIFSRLTRASLERAREDGVHLIFNTPNPQSMAGYLKLGWTLVGRPRLLLRPLRPLRLAASLLRPRTFRATGDPTRLVGPMALPVEALLAHGDAVEQLVRADDRLSGDGIRTARSLEFLRWRYAAPPSPRYYALWSGEVPTAACAIFRPSIRRGLGEIMLTELLLGASGTLAARQLLRRLARLGQGDYIVAAATPGTTHWRVLRRSGFLPLPVGSGRNLVVMPLQWPPEAPDPVRIASWRLSLGDMEIF